MPGNIRVAVLEAVDLPATVTAGKSVAVKVAVGKREFQTILAEAQDGRTQPWNSEFLFPVLNLRDNLLVAIMDSKGEMVAKAELETPGIVQKGFQDAFVAMKAGGRIHVKVSFVLSEEERKKIEAMRVSSLKKRKGFTNQAGRSQLGRSRQAPVSNVKITEITEDSSGPGSVATAESTTDKRNSIANEQQHASITIPANVQATASAKNELDFSDTDSKCKGQKPAEPPHGQADRQIAQAAAEGSRWLNGLKQKSKVEQVRAIRADEWIKNLDAQQQGVPRSWKTPEETIQQEGLKLKMQLQEEGERLQRFEAKASREENTQEKAQKAKSVKQRLEDWKLKELGPWWRSTSKVRHASPPESEQSPGSKKIRWLAKKPKPEEEEKVPSEHGSTTREDLMAAADRMWASTMGSPPRSSTASERDKRRSGGFKGAMKQVFSGFGSAIWQRKKKQERYHIVKEGETLSSIVPEQWNNPDSKFFYLNPQVRDSGLVYPGQRLRLH